MELEGSCYCGVVRFRVTSTTPYPFMRCYCTVCRKTAGAGGYAINIMARADTLRVEGDDNLAFHQARIEDPDHPGRMTTSPGKRYFCQRCGSPLWVVDPRWSEWVYPFASAIDTPLPKPPAHVNIMLDFAAPWCPEPTGTTEHNFRGYPEESIYDWHQRHASD